MKRITNFCAVVLFSIFTSVLTAAPKTEGNIKKIKPKNPVTLNVYSQLANYSGIQTGWMADVLLEKFNVILNIVPNSDGKYDELMAAGNFGDIVVWGDNTDDYTNACKQGLLLDWDAKLDGKNTVISQYGPYMQANMRQALQKNKYMDSPDKKLHGYGYSVSTSAKDLQSFFYTWDLRFDLYEQIGKPKIKDLYDMIEVLEKMKEICPSDDNGNPTYGLSMFNDWDGSMVMYVKALATAYYGYDELDFGLYNPEDGKFYDCLADNGPYLYCLKFINQLYQKGLLDPDSKTQKLAGLTEDYKNGTAFWIIFNWLGSGLYNTDEHKAAGKAMYPVVPSEAHPMVYGQSVFGGNRLWTIGSKTKYPELCMAIINWLSTPEGCLTMKYGPEKVCWEIKNEKTYFTDFGKKAYENQSDTIMPSPYKGSFEEGLLQINNTTWCDDAYNPLTKEETYNCYYWESEQKEASSEIEKNWREWSKAATPDRYMRTRKYSVSPGSLFTNSGVPADLTEKWNAVAECIKTETWNAIYAKTDAEYEEIVKKMISSAKEKGYDECCAETRKKAEKRFTAEKLVQ